MQGHNIVAIYDTRDKAEAARAELASQGFTDVRLSEADGEQSESYRQTYDSDRSASQGSGFLGWLFGDVEETDRNLYRSNLHGDRTAVSVYADTRADEAEGILERFDPVELDDGMSATDDSSDSSVRTSDNQGDTVIPIARERLDVGKTVDETRRRIRTHVVERPVEADVTLRDERIVVERRPATGAAAMGGDAFKEREFEVVERHERPVVGKSAEVAEEVVVHKDATERTETVRDTVRETEIEGEPESDRRRRDGSMER